MFLSIGREHHWPPSVLGGLFFDREDYQGLFFWYDDLVELSRKKQPQAPQAPQE